MFMAAFTSLSWSVLHSGHVQYRSESVRFSLRYPQLEQGFVVGSQRLAFKNVLPYLAEVH